MQSMMYSVTIEKVTITWQFDFISSDSCILEPRKQPPKKHDKTSISVNNYDSEAIREVVKFFGKREFHEGRTTMAQKKGEVARGWGRLLVKPTILEKNLENVLISQWLPNAVYTVYKGHIQNSLCFTFRPQHLSCLPLKSSHSIVAAFSRGFFVCKLNLNF